jgi:hypothetical protein
MRALDWQPLHIEALPLAASASAPGHMCKLVLSEGLTQGEQLDPAVFSELRTASGISK